MIHMISKQLQVYPVLQRSQGGAHKGKHFVFLLFTLISK
jgi:hypothetical protein